MKQFLKNIMNFFTCIYYRRKNTGKKVHIDRTVHVLGWRRVRIGSHCVISEGCSFNVNHRNNVSIQIEIGKNCYIGRRNFFTSGKSIKIGDFLLSGPDCKFLGSSHKYTDPFKPFIATGTDSSTVIVLGANCCLGANVTILGNVTIGHGSIIGAGSFVTKNIPPFSLAYGNPANITKRFDMGSKEWVSANSFTDDMENMLPDETSYLATVREHGSSLIMPIAPAGVASGDLP